MKKYLKFLIIFILTYITSASADENIVFILKGRGNIFWKTIAEGIKETAKEQKLHVSIFHTDDDQKPEQQLNICLTALETKPSMLVVGAATKNVGIECYKEAKKRGIPFADIDGNVAPDEAMQAGVPLAFSVTSDNCKIGVLGAEQLSSFVS